MPYAIPDITKHLESKGFQVLNAFPLEQASPTLDALALLIAFQFPLFGPLLQHMRGNIREKPGFHHNLDYDLSQNEVGTLKSLCQLLKANGLLEKWGTQGGNTLIRGVVANDERAFGFLTGGWLEGAVRFYIQQFLNLEGHEVEIVQNAK